MFLIRLRSVCSSIVKGTHCMILASPASASTLEILYDIPRFALTVRLKSPSKTENTSVVAPPISTPIKFRCCSDRFHDDADRRRRRHDRRAGHLDQFLVARRLLHACSRNRSCILFRAGARFSAPVLDEILSVSTNAVFSPGSSSLAATHLCTCVDQQELVGRPEAGRGSAADMYSRHFGHMGDRPRPSHRTLRSSGRMVLIRSVFSCGHGHRSTRASMTIAPAVRRAAPLTRHILHDTGHHHL